VLPPPRGPPRKPPPTHLARKLPRLDLADMLEHKGENYSQAIAELGFQLMAMRLTAEQAVNVTRAFKRNF
jgi:hypothetical protein